MLAGGVYMEGHQQVSGIVYRNIWVKFGLETPRSGVGHISKGWWRMTKDPGGLLDYRLWWSKRTDAEVPTNSIRQEGQESSQDVREQLEKMWGVKTCLPCFLLGTPGAPRRRQAGLGSLFSAAARVLVNGPLVLSSCLLPESGVWVSLS